MVLDPNTCIRCDKFACMICDSSVINQMSKLESHRSVFILYICEECEFELEKFTSIPSSM